MGTKNFTLTQGDTFSAVLRWQSAPIVYKAISAITNTAPAQITAASHGLVDGWPVAIASVKGMTEINTELDSDGQPKKNKYVKATVVDPNTITLNSVNSSDFHVFKLGGYVQYYTPVDLTGFIARMTIKDKVGGTVLVALVSPTDIVIDNVAKTITITISATATAAYASGKYVYDLEMVSATGVVTKLIQGSVTVLPEVTT